MKDEMNPEVKEQLKRLAYFLDATNNNAGQRTPSHLLWGVLCALRGPDFSIPYQWDSSQAERITDTDIKDATTAVIRFELCRLSPIFNTEARFWNGSRVSRDTEEFAALRVRLADEPSAIIEDGEGAHFLDHAMLAFNALGLQWREVNP